MEDAQALDADELRLHRRLLARGELPLGRADLPARQPAAPRAAALRAREAAPARAFRDDARPEPDLGAPEPRDPRPAAARDLRHRAGARRAGDRRERVPRGHVLRALPERRPGRGRAARALPPVLVPGWDSEPRRARDARLDPRGRRAGVRARARIRCRLRQPRPARLLRSRRRRGRDRAAGDELALEQVPERGDGRRRSPRPAPERLQDREPDRARAHPGAGARGADGGLRPPAGARLRRRPRGRPPGTRRRARRRAGRHLPDPAGGARGPGDGTPALADDRPAHAEGLDGPEGGRRQAGRGNVALAPGADVGCPRQQGSRPAARGVDAQLPAGGALRRARTCSSRNWPRWRRRASCA